MKIESFEKFIGRKRHSLIKMKDIGRKGFYFFEREAITCMPQYNLDEKYYIVERLKLVKTEGAITNKKNKIGDVEYRIGYYIVGKIGRGKNRWMWGQFCPMIPDDDFTKLFEKAKKENTIL
jgi:hypothetical protein